MSLWLHTENKAPKVFDQDSKISYTSRRQSGVGCLNFPEHFLCVLLLTMQSPYKKIAFLWIYAGSNGKSKKQMEMKEAKTATTRANFSNYFSPLDDLRVWNSFWPAALAHNRVEFVKKLKIVSNRFKHLQLCHIHLLFVCFIIMASAVVAAIKRSLYVCVSLVVSFDKNKRVNSGGHWPK